MGESLLKRALDGDASAWDALVTRHEAMIYGIVLRTGLAPDEAGDACQQVWMALLEGGASIRDAQALPRWLAVTARRTAHRLMSRRRAAGTVPLSEDLEESGPSAEELIELAERRRVLRDALATLPERCRTLLTALFETARPSYPRIARTLGMPVGSIGPNRARCLARLYRRLRRKRFEF